MKSFAFADFVDTDIPNRLDRLPWSQWHARIVAALSVTWLLDGLEGSLGGSLAGALKDRSGLGFSDGQLGLSSSFYLGGAIAGALLFGYLADRFGRRRLFTWTLLLYVCATAATGLSWNLLSFTLFRVLTGAGIGGEYAAINSAVDERYLLGRDRPGIHSFCGFSPSLRFRTDSGLASCISHRSSHWNYRSVDAAVHSGKPAMVDRSWAA
jgi:MFS family permease